MKEFDKIYIAKYIDIDSITNIAYSLGKTNKDIENVITELKDNGLYQVYKEMSDEEWEQIENKSDSYIQKKYLDKIKNDRYKAFYELLNLFKPTKHRFKIYYEEDYKLKPIKSEKWKQIKDFHYSISNYGRVKNNITNKIKESRMHKGILQCDIYEKKKRYTIALKRAVANYFIRELEPGERVICKDNNGNNLYYKNLEIVSR